MKHAKLLRFSATFIVMAIGIAACLPFETHAPSASWSFDAEEATRRQDATAKALGVPKELVLDVGDEVPMRLVLIPAGKFMMGSPEGEVKRNEDEGPQHIVTITQPFYMGIDEVTQGQYHAIMWMRRMNSEFDRGPSLPVEAASWEDAMDFCAKLSAKTGKKVSLPTEAEWEYACRAGTETRFNTGETIRRDQANISDDKGCFWPLMPVGSFKPNGFGLYDMHGNVAEWCSDLYDHHYYHQAAITDPVGPSSVEDFQHVVRGGSRGLVPFTCRSACRFLSQDTHHSGFRVVVTLNAEPDSTNPVEKAGQLVAAARVRNKWDFRAERNIPIELASLGPAAKPVILAAINDPDKQVRDCASAALSYVPDESDIPMLLSDVPEAEANVAMKMLGPVAVKPLIAALKHENPSIRQRAVQIVYEVDPSAAADPVLEMGMKDKNKDSRYVALEVALTHGDKRALDPLLAAIEADAVTAKANEDNLDAPWCSALQTAFTYGGERGADLFTSTVQTGKITVWEIPELGPRDARLIPYLIEGLDSRGNPCLPYRSWELLCAYQDDPRAVAALTAHGWTKEDRSLDNESLESLLGKLLALDADTAADAAYALGKRGEKLAVKPLLDFIATRHSWGRHSALIALGDLGDPSAIPMLVKFLDSEPPNNNSSWDLRLSAIQALGELRAKEAVERLIVIAGDPRSYGPSEATEALGKIGGERALSALDGVFRTSPDISLREDAWRALRESRSRGDSGLAQ